MLRVRVFQCARVPPSQVVVTAYSLVPAGLALSSAPKSFLLAGSLDGVTWTFVDSETGVSGWANGTGQVFIVEPPYGHFNYYRLVVRASGGSGLSVGELYLFGSVYKGPPGPKDLNLQLALGFSLLALLLCVFFVRCFLCRKRRKKGGEGASGDVIGDGDGDVRKPRPPPGRPSVAIEMATKMFDNPMPGVVPEAKKLPVPPMAPPPPKPATDGPTIVSNPMSVSGLYKPTRPPGKRPDKKLARATAEVESTVTDLDADIVTQTSQRAFSPTRARIRL